MNCGDTKSKKKIFHFYDYHGHRYNIPLNVSLQIFRGSLDPPCVNPDDGSLTGSAPRLSFDHYPRTELTIPPRSCFSPFRVGPSGHDSHKWTKELRICELGFVKTVKVFISSLTKFTRVQDSLVILWKSPFVWLYNKLKVNLQNQLR